MSKVVPLEPTEQARTSPCPEPEPVARSGRARARPISAVCCWAWPACTKPTRPQGGRADALADIFIALTRSAERDIRQALAERLADADWAPAALIQMLAADEIEIARPMIAASPLLLDDDLLQLLVDCSIEHQIEVARRPDLGGDGGARHPRARRAGGDDRPGHQPQRRGWKPDGFAELVEQSRASWPPCARRWRGIPRLDEPWPSGCITGSARPCVRRSATASPSIPPRWRRAVRGRDRAGPPRANRPTASPRRRRGHRRAAGQQAARGRPAAPRLSDPRPARGKAGRLRRTALAALGGFDVAHVRAR